MGGDLNTFNKKYCLAFAALALQQSAFAGGTAFTENNVGSMGSAFAGAAAEAADPSVLYTNPAALTRFKKAEVSQGAVFASIKTPYTDSASGQTFERDTPAQALAPFLYMAIPVNDKLTLGASASASHALVVRYPQNYPGNSQGTDLDLKITRLNFGAGYKLSKTLSIGGNLSYERYFNAIRLHINYRAAVSGLTNPTEVGLLDAAAGLGLAPAIPSNDSSALLSVLGYAFNVQGGLLWEPTENTRVGLGYRPKTKFKNSGYLTISEDANQQAFINFLNGPLAAVIDPAAGSKAKRLDPLQSVSQEITMPSELNLSLFHHATPKLDLMAGLSVQDFSVTQLQFLRSDDNNSNILNIPQYFAKAKRYALGMNYRVYRRLVLKAGVAKETGVVADAYRIPVLPDSDRRYFNLGAGLDISPYTNIQVAYEHLNAKQGQLGNNAFDPPISAAYNGTVKLDANFLGVQLNSKF